MRIDPETDAIYIRQSSLKDFLLCPERLRLTTLNPEMKSYNDSAAMGTACHTGIEMVLNRQIMPGDIAEASVAAFAALRAKEYEEHGKDIRVTNTNPAQWNTHIASMSNAWVNDIMPSVPLGGQTEFKFAVKVGEVERVQPAENGSTHHDLYFEGTADYVCEGEAWDWKTSGRKYSFNEKQTQDIQSSVYATALVGLGLAEFPMNFSFGVMIRNASSTGQILTVTRDQGSSDFVVAQAVAMAGTILTMETFAPAKQWQINDQHFLCSERWCPVYSLCKGRHINAPDDGE